MTSESLLSIEKNIIKSKKRLIIMIRNSLENVVSFLGLRDLQGNRFLGNQSKFISCFSLKSLLGRLNQQSLQSIRNTFLCLISIHPRVKEAFSFYG